ncbi:MAG: flavodoxin-dependent (E)-4-hydroxy-3-methylbut-2-enyl-diphosphate synthase, partial [Spirochaetales bacterium]|nr:flavodoxin-dependent (E)-4-hydroxy-3-methylbut-2-enyl-diphosphate synthase [Spirochaetales bacterium]
MIKIGNIELKPGIIPVQTMIKNPTTDVALTLHKINHLASIGCDIIRITVPDEPSVEAIRMIARESPIPVVADIHFDYRLAIGAIQAGVAKVRINPGNIGDESRVASVISCLKEYG